MRMIVYGTLLILAGLLLYDTNYGHTVDPQTLNAVREAHAYLKTHKAHSDARILEELIANREVRRSRFYAYLAKIQDQNSQEFAFYAYTPVFSRSKVYLGPNFYQLHTLGQASILCHEMAHIRWHRKRILRGLPRGQDEAQAYEHQYLMHNNLRLSSSGTDSIVYWDMMVGIQAYVIPLHPTYARRPDVKAALKIFAEGGD